MARRIRPTSLLAALMLVTMPVAAQTADLALRDGRVVFERRQP